MQDTYFKWIRAFWEIFRRKLGRCMITSGAWILSDVWSAECWRWHFFNKSLFNVVDDEVPKRIYVSIRYRQKSDGNWVTSPNYCKHRLTLCIDSWIDFSIKRVIDKWQIGREGYSKCEAKRDDKRRWKWKNEFLSVDIHWWWMANMTFNATPLIKITYTEKDEQRWPKGRSLAGKSSCDTNCPLKERSFRR